MGEEVPQMLVTVRHVPQQGGGGIGQQEPLGQAAVLVHPFLVCCQEQKGLVLCRTQMYGDRQCHTDSGDRYMDHNANKITLQNCTYTHSGL